MKRFTVAETPRLKRFVAAEAGQGAARGTFRAKKD